MDHGAVSLGVRTHSAHGGEEGGWATYVVLGGRIADPEILVRGRTPLCDSEVEGSNQPFHRASATFPFDHTQPMDVPSAEAFIDRCRQSSRDLAGRALDDIIGAHGALSACCILTGPPRPLPPLRAILASHGLMHAAEREFFRDAVREAAVRRAVTTELVNEKDLLTLAARLPGKEAGRREALSAFGKQVGSPWAQDEKLAATAAWLGLALQSS